MPVFTAIILTAPPPGQMSEAGGPMVRIDGKEAVLRSAELFVNRPEIKQVVIVFQPEELDSAKKRFGSHFAFTGISVAAGGPHWLDQAAAAVEKLTPETTHVLLHDAARCCVPYNDIDQLVRETEQCDSGVALVSPMRATVLEVGPKGEPLAYHTPERYLQLLTPQGFTRAAYEEMGRTKQVVPASTIRIVKGSPLNVRVGGPGDEKLVKTLMTMLPKPVKEAGGPFQEAQW